MLFHPENIKKALSKNFEGEVSHRKMLPPNRVLKVAPEEKNALKNSSVLLLLFIENDELIACLIKRPTQMKYHAGQIALPGGRIEEGETAIETALRETYEEIGIQSSDIEILGSLSEFYIEVSKFQIQPFVGWLHKKPEFRINSDEVEKTILFPIKHFKAPFNVVKMETLSGEIKVPFIKFDGEIIWGATAMILSEFADILQSISE